MPVGVPTLATRVTRVLLVWGLLVCAGCHVFPSPTKTAPRSLEELYFEAKQASQLIPENTIEPYATDLDAGEPSLGDVSSLHSGDVMPSGDAVTQGKLSEGISTNAGPTLRERAPTRRDSQIVRVSGTADPTTQRLVSDIFEDTDIRQAIQALATQAGVSVIIDERVGGVTTSFIEKEPFEQALRKILLPLGLVYRVHQGQYLIGTTEPTSAMFPLLSESLEYRPENLSPAELVPLLPERLQSYVRTVDKRNVMLIEAPSEMAHQIYQQLQLADEPVPQVMLEAIVCVYNPNETYRFNAEVRQALKHAGEDVLNLGSLGLALSGSASPFGIKNAFTDFATTSIFLRLLAQEGYVTIRAAPRVMAKDGEKATINIARETFFSTTANNADIIFSQNIKQVDAGISLDIVPVIRGDNVTVNIEKAEVSENITTSDTSENLVSPFPLINRRQVSTTVHVKDGQTIVIGGLVQRQTIDRISRVPYLSSIPLLGKVFERVEQEDTEAEVAIFISPKIIWPAGCRRPQTRDSQLTENDSQPWESPRFHEEAEVQSQQYQPAPTWSPEQTDPTRQPAPAPVLQPQTPAPTGTSPSNPEGLSSTRANRSSGTARAIPGTTPSPGTPGAATPPPIRPASPSATITRETPPSSAIASPLPIISPEPTESPDTSPGPASSTPSIKVILPKPVLKTVPAQAFP